MCAESHHSVYINPNDAPLTFIVESVTTKKTPTNCVHIFQSPLLTYAGDVAKSSHRMNGNPLLLRFTAANDDVCPESLLAEQLPQ